MLPLPDRIDSRSPVVHSDTGASSCADSAATSGAMKLLVPLDGSTASERALEHALSLAAGNPATIIILLNVQTPEVLGLSDIRARSQNDRMLADRRSEEVLRRPVETCGKHHVSCEKRAEYRGTVAETIVRVARETGADQIVMGARGLGRLRGLMLGSVTTQVVHLADVPVTLVKAAPRAPAGA
jgi:nucleotide-binding universal stress UspA family protein